MELSVLDLVPVRTDQRTGDALAASTELVELADRVGCTRYWVAEHHNMPAVAATAPAVVLAAIAGRTERIRLGSGGVMLPNHAPLAVAEQFALLASAFPGRIDLGIGRAPGSDQVTALALRGPAGRDDADLEDFPRHVDDVAALVAVEGAAVALPQRSYRLLASPAADSEPTLWLLGSSQYSAQLAAAKGMPYVFAHHFSGQGTAEALALYRERFQPSEALDAPRTFLTVNASVAETEDEARDQLLPNLLSMARLRTGKPLRPLDTIEDAKARTIDAHEQAIVDAGMARAVVGTPDQAATRLAELAERFGVDEVMVHPVASAHRGVDPRTSPGRCFTVEALAAAVGADG